MGSHALLLSGWSRIFKNEASKYWLMGGAPIRCSFVAAFRKILVWGLYYLPFISSLSLHQIGDKIRKFISHNDTETVIHTSISSKFVNCNGLLCGLQNSAARLITRTKTSYYTYSSSFYNQSVRRSRTTTYDDRFFARACPRLWNQLPPTDYQTIQNFGFF